jgi:hypothetical protein
MPHLQPGDGEVGLVGDAGGAGGRHRVHLHQEKRANFRSEFKFRFELSIESRKRIQPLKYEMKLKFRTRQELGIRSCNLPSPREGDTASTL